MPWEIELEFATTHEDADGYWDYVEDTVTKSWVFHTEEEARAFFREAHEAVQAYQRGEVWSGPGPWVPVPEDAEEDQPPKEALDFVEKHDVTVFDLDGVPCGGFFQGVLVEGYALALSGVLRVVEFRDVGDEWAEGMGR
ncbi:MAG: hypothetical protein ACYTFG_20095 [Planctomycetota bacterium]|jgi:hypothetical protein